MGRPPGRPAAGPRPSGPGSGSPAEAGQLRLKPDAGGRAGTQGGGRQVCSARPRSGSRASQAGTEGAPRGSQRGRPPSPQPHFLSRAGRRPWQGGRNCSAPALPPAACTRPGRRRPPSPECSRQKRPRTSRAGRERGDQDGGREAETPAPAQRGGRWGGGGRGRGRGEGGPWGPPTPFSPARPQVPPRGLGTDSGRSPCCQEAGTQPSLAQRTRAAGWLDRGFCLHLQRQSRGGPGRCRQGQGLGAGAGSYRNHWEGRALLAGRWTQPHLPLLRGGCSCCSRDASPRRWSRGTRLRQHLPDKELAPVTSAAGREPGDGAGAACGALPCPDSRGRLGRPQSLTGAQARKLAWGHLIRSRLPGPFPAGRQPLSRREGMWVRKAARPRAALPLRDHCQATLHAIPCREPPQDTCPPRPPRC